MAKWKCKNCGEHDGVENGFCPRCGPQQTLPQDDDAEKEADVAGAAAFAKDEAKLAKEAEERNAASIKAGQK